MRQRRDLFHRWEGNPAIRLQDLPFNCLDIRNAGAVKVGDTYILLLTIEALDGRARIFRAESTDGHDFKVHAEPVLAPTYKEPFFIYELNGVEDPRITKIDDTYYITYVSVSSSMGVCTSLMSTKDFESYDRHGILFPCENKDVVLFPEKVGGYYYAFHRPVGHINIRII